MPKENMNEKLEKTIDAIKMELITTTENPAKGHFNSPHEGYAVIKEELEELWDEIKHGYNIEAACAEAIQVAAMAIRFILDFKE